MIRHWKRTLVIVVIGGVLIGALHHNRDRLVTMMQKAEAPAEEPAAVAPARVPVRVGNAETREFERTLRLQGTVEAKETAVVPARLGGTLVALFVDEGDRVEKGKTELFRTDDVKLRQAVDSADLQLAIARCALEEKRALVEKTRTDLAKARTDHDRYTKLFAEGAVTEDELERRRTDFRRWEADLKVAESRVNLSAEQVRQAETALDMAKKDLADSLVVAPIDGVVTEKLAELGEMGQPGKPVFRIEQVDDLEISVFAPAEYLPDIRPGKTVARLSTAGMTEPQVATVSYVSPTVDRQLRVFEVKCRVAAADRWRPGQMVEVELVLDSRQAVGVPAESVLRRRSGWVAFTVDDDTAHQLTVQPGLESHGWLALAGGEVKAGMPIVVMGQFLLNDGTAVNVQEAR